MTKDNAIEKLKNQIEPIELVKLRNSSSPEFKKWLRDTEIAIEKIFGKDTRHLHDFSDISYTPLDIDGGTPEYVDRQVFLSGLNDANVLLESMIKEISEYWEEEKHSYKGGKPIDIVIRLCERFHIVVRKIRNRHANRKTINVDDEYDVQDLLHALLSVNFDDIRPEEWTPSYAGCCSRVDFLLKQEKIIIEVKMTRKGLGAKEVGDQLLIDIQRYQTHPDCNTLFCFVYDPEGIIANPRGIENDLNKEDHDFCVKVIVAPKGI